MKFLLAIYILGFLFVSSVSPLHAQVQPDPPIIKRVSLLNSSDSVRIDWTLSDSTDVEYYVVLKPPPGKGWEAGWFSIDTSFSASRNSFTFKEPSALNDSVSFRMWAVDSAGHPSALSNIHTLNFLKITPDNCNYSMHLKWTGYKGWGDSLVKYQVWIKQGVQPEKFYADTNSVSGDFVYTKMLTDTLYCFVIRAINRDSSVSLSNQQCKSIHIPKSPAFINADYASIDGTGKIALSFSFDSTSELGSYVLLRAENDTGLYSTIQSFSAANKGNLKYIDAQADPLVQHYYKLTAINTCGYAMKGSNIAGNIVLHAAEVGNQVLLDWNKYESWAGGAGNDTLMRSTPADGWEFAATIPPSDANYTDNLDSLAYRNYKYKICYYIKASQDSLNPSGIKGISLSNTACVPSPAEVKIPNAFTPNDDGKNDEFMPQFKFTPEEYLLKIFDRNGNILFQTTSTSDPWNGTDMKGQKVPQGTYVYYLRYRFQSQSTKELRGTISVLYP